MSIHKFLMMNQPVIGRLICELNLLTDLRQKQFLAALAVNYHTPVLCKESRKRARSSQRYSVSKKSC